MAKRTWLVAGLIAALGVTAGAVAIQASADVAPVAVAEQRPGPGPGRGGGKDHPPKLREGVTLVVGTVKSVESGKLVVTKDGGGEASVTTDSATRFRGGELSGLKQGQRVLVHVKDGKAVGVSVPKSRASGTVTSVDGDKAVLIQQDGLQVGLDLSGLTEKPKAGDLVTLTGTVSDGKTIKVEKVRQLPK